MDREPPPRGTVRAGEERRRERSTDGLPVPPRRFRPGAQPRARIINPEPGFPAQERVVGERPPETHPVDSRPGLPDPIDLPLYRREGNLPVYDVIDGKTRPSRSSASAASQRFGREALHGEASVRRTTTGRSTTTGLASAATALGADPGLPAPGRRGGRRGSPDCRPVHPHQLDRKGALTGAEKRNARYYTSSHTHGRRAGRQNRLPADASPPSRSAREPGAADEGRGAP